VTINYFGNSDVWHHFTFYYICMRPKMQPDDVKVVFSWNLLGIKRLTSSKAQDYTFSITVSGSKVARERFVARHRTPKGIHKVTAFGLCVEKNIHVPEEETLRTTVENTFKVLDCLLRK